LDRGFTKILGGLEGPTKGLTEVLEGLGGSTSPIQGEQERAQKSLLITIVILKESKEECDKLRKKYPHWKARILRYLKELSFVPWLWDQV
jgi:hypothetical protein